MTDALRIEGLCKKYADFQLDHVTFSLPKGSIMGFVGENGAGKTTTIKAILNLIAADSGKIEVLGLDHKKDEPSRSKSAWCSITAAFTPA